MRNRLQPMMCVYLYVNVQVCVCVCNSNTKDTRLKLISFFLKWGQRFWQLRTYTLHYTTFKHRCSLYTPRLYLLVVMTHKHFNTLLKSDVTCRDHVVRCRGSQECGSRFVNFIRDGTVFALLWNLQYWCACAVVMCEPQNRDNGASEVWALTGYYSKV